MASCPLCGGEKKVSTTTYSVDFGAGVVVVRDVPATTCGQCGEDWIEPDVAKQLERIVQSARAVNSQIEVVSYQAAGNSCAPLRS